MPRPDLTRIPVFYHVYVNQVQQTDLMTALKEQTDLFKKFLRKLPEEKRNYRYAKGKWTIKEVLQHIIDAERVFAYRALCFSRKDKTPLPSFDENLYADNSKAGKRNWNEMVEEFTAVRRSTELLFGSLDKAQLNETGIASSNPVYVMGVGYVIAGHLAHHLNILKERYLTSL
ncbi:MAG: DinB family protein [Chitinophagaceae bacterium]